MLDKLIPMSLPYPIRGGIIRAIRTAIAILLAALAVSIADGSIIESFSFIPAEYAPVILLALSTAFAGLDKWLRERGLVAEDAEIPLVGNVDEV
jgi:hypothetical protein